MSEANYSKRSFPAILVKNRKFNRPGYFFYLYSNGVPAGIISCLPNAGDKDSSWGTTMFTGHGSPNHQWAWNGNILKPSLTPSIHRVGHWHGYLTDGKFISAG